MDNHVRYLYVKFFRMADISRIKVTYFGFEYFLHLIDLKIISHFYQSIMNTLLIYLSNDIISFDPT